jgi:hypothetical protein
MAEHPQSGGAAEPGARSRSDVGRRIRARREELGLSRAKAATLAGAAPGYLEYVEEQPSAPNIGFLLRLAHALETTAGELMGGAVEVPPGVGRAIRSPELRPLTEAECRRLLGTHGVGRIAVCPPHGPAIVPVNYQVADGAVAYRTAPGSLPAAVCDQLAAFEVDRVDEAMSVGWSVLVVGTARAAGPARARELERQAFTEPWAGGDRGLWLVIEPDWLTGRRITAGGEAARAGSDRWRR